MHVEVHQLPALCPELDVVDDHDEVINDLIERNNITVREMNEHDCLLCVAGHNSQPVRTHSNERRPTGYRDGVGSVSLTGGPIPPLTHPPGSHPRSGEFSKTPTPYQEFSNPPTLYQEVFLRSYLS